MNKRIRFSILTVRKYLKLKFKFQVFPSRQDRKKQICLFFGRSYDSTFLFQDLMTFSLGKLGSVKFMEFNTFYTIKITHDRTFKQWLWLNDWAVRVGENIGSSPDAFLEETNVYHSEPKLGIQFGIFWDDLRFPWIVYAETILFWISSILKISYKIHSVLKQCFFSWWKQGLSADTRSIWS